MSKIIFVNGPQGAGKSTFIQENFFGREGHFILDLAAISRELFGTYDELEGDGLAEIYNHASEKGMFALLEDETLVVEFCTGRAYDEEIILLIEFAKRIGIQVQVININPEDSTPPQEDERDPYSSYDLREDTLEVLEGILESYELNREFELIVELGGEEGSINFYKMVKDGEVGYFFISTKLNAFDFEPKYEFEKDENVFYLPQFSTFKDAFEAFLREFPVYQLIPIQVNAKYKAVFQKAFVDSMENPANKAWKTFFN